MLKSKKRFVLALATIFVFMFTAVAGAAIPDNSVIIGDKAFSTDFLMDTDNLDTVQAALDGAAGAPMYYHLTGQADVWTSIMDNVPATQEELDALPQITYTAKDGTTSEYAAGNGDLITSEPEKLAIKSVVDIAETLTVGDEYTLPATVSVTVEGEEEAVEMEVEWDGEVDTTKAGTFEFEGTLVLPEGYVNPDEVVVKAAIVVEEAEVSGLIVESVSAITTTGVTVEFEALEEALEDVAVTVVDSESNEVEVEALATIAKGATSATFNFVDELEEEALTGVWKVNGVNYDFAERAAVAEVVKAGTANNLVKLWAALKSPYFEGAIEENIEAYQEAIDNEDTVLVTAEDVNKMIADANKAAVEGEKEAAKVKAVKEAIDANVNDLKFLRVLQDNGFKFINEDAVGEYRGGIENGNSKPEGIAKLFNDNGTDVTFKDIQGAINEVNIYKADKAANEVFTNLQADDLKTARGLAAYLSNEDEIAKDEGITIREFANDHLDVLAALIAVNKADTTSALKSALVALDQIDTAMAEKYEGIDAVDGDYNVSVFGDEKEFDIKTVKDANLKGYLDGIADAGNKDKNQRSDIQGLIDSVNQDFNNRIKFTEKEDDDFYFETTNKIVRIADKQQYKDKGRLLGYEVWLDISDGSENNNPPISATKDITVELYKGEKQLGYMTLKDDVRKDKNGYTIAGTIDVYGEYVAGSWIHDWDGEITDIPDKIVATVVYEDGVATCVKEGEEFTFTSKELQPFYLEVVNEAKTVEEMDAALLQLNEIDEKSYLNVPSADRAFVAQKVLDARNVIEAHDGGRAKKFAKWEDLVTGENGENGENGALTQAIEERQSALDGVNGLDYSDAEIISKVIGALKTIDPEGFGKMEIREQSNIAETFINGLELVEVEGEGGKAELVLKTSFKTLAAIKAAAGL